MRSVVEVTIGRKVYTLTDQTPLAQIKAVMRKAGL